MKKRASLLSLIIIMGIMMMLIIVGSVVYSVAKSSSPSTNSEIKPLVSYTETCLKNVLEDSLIVFGLQGGYVYPENPLLFQDMNISKDKLPEKEKAEMEISSYIENNIAGCLKDYEPYKEQFASIETGEPNVETFIGDDKVNVQLEMPLKAVKGKEKHQKDKFMAEKDIRIGKLLKYGNTIQSSEDADLTYLGNLDVMTTIIEHDEGSIFFLKDAKSKIREDKDYIFVVFVEK